MLLVGSFFCKTLTVKRLPLRALRQANAYLLVLIPQMLHHGVPSVPESVFLFGFGATAFGSSVAVGLLSNLPIPAGCGIGCATFYAYSLAAKAQDSDKASYAATTCLLSATLMLVAALFGLSWRLFKLVPKSVKEAMPIGLGLMLSMSGFEQMRLVIPQNETGVTMGDLTSPTAITGCVATLLMVFMHSHHWRSAFLLPIILTTIFAWVVSTQGWIEFDTPAHLPTAVLETPQAFWFDRYISFETWGAPQITSAAVAAVSM